MVAESRRRRLFGHPDFVFPRARLAVFVDGCFWHCCPRHSTLPTHNRAFWLRKLSANRRRDLAVARRLAALGWRVLRVWEHELESGGGPGLVRRLKERL